MYYVYVWHKPNGVPFYVGIGKTAKRWNPVYVHSQSRNKHCFNTVLKIGAENVNVTLIESLEKFDACRLEQTLIYFYGRKDLGSGPLTNMTDGGDGVKG